MAANRVSWWFLIITDVLEWKDIFPYTVCCALASGVHRHQDGVQNSKGESYTVGGIREGNAVFDILF